MDLALEIQKGSFWKRISAWLFDKILLFILAIGTATLLSLIFQYDARLNAYRDLRTSIEEKYGITFGITEQEYNSYDEAKKAKYDEAYEALNANKEAVKLYSLITNLALLIVTFSFLIAYLILEFFVPLLFRNGMTLGKKIFGLGVMKQNSVRITGPILFIRTILGKYAVELMIPAFVIIKILLGQGNILFFILLLLVPLVNLIMVIATQNNCFLHDLLSMTCVVDYASQRIFDTEQEMIDYVREQHEAEEAEEREENVFQTNQKK